MLLIRKIAGLAKKFQSDTRGNVALMFGVTAIPMMLAGGIAVDYANASKVKASIQAAVDNAALAAGYDTSMTDGEMLKLVQKYLKANGAEDTLKSLDEVKVKRIGSTGLKVSAKGKVDNYLMRIIGNNTTDIGAETFIKNNYGNLEVALVLDNTFSM